MIVLPERFFLPAASILMLALTWLIYFQGLGGPLLLDDSPQLQPILSQADSPPGDLVDAFAISTSGPLGRPVSMLTFVADAVLHGDDTRWWKHTNVLIHLACGILVFALTTVLVGHTQASPRIRPSMFGVAVTALWLLHPLQVSTVLYTVQRMTELSTLFVLAGLLCYALGRIAHERSAVRGWVLIGVAFGVFYPLGLLSKENAVLLPLYCTLLEIFVFRMQGHGSIGMQVKALHAFLALGYLICAVVVLFDVAGIVRDSYAYRDFSLAERVLTQPRVLVAYLLQILVPVPGQLGFFHDDIVVSRGFLDPATTLAAWLVVFALIGSAIVAWRRLPLYAFGILFFFATHLLESTVIGLELMFEHRNYLGLLGILLAGGDLLRQVVPKPSAMAAAAAVLVIITSALTFDRVQTWSSPGELYVAAYESHPASPRVNLVLANAATATGDFTAARRHLLRTGSGFGSVLHGLFLDCLESGALTADRIAAIRNVEHGVVEAHTTSSANSLVTSIVDHDCRVDDERLLAMFDVMLSARIRSDMDHQQLLMAKARLLESVRDPGVALLAYSGAQSATPDDALPSYTAADLLIRHGRFEEALNMLGAADGIDANGRGHRRALARTIYAGFGELLDSREMYDLAADVYRQASRRFPADAFFYLSAANALISGGDPDAAAALIDQMLDERRADIAGTAALYEAVVARLGNMK
ncbi:MAG: hypothetical protein V2I25_14230 [Woeseiaceae bacterium]|jgi:tetratricopeptide (TPR) repeat protein|nr:hypothetical protein [Woeseiaceae bacterium]